MTREDCQVFLHPCTELSLSTRNVRSPRQREGARWPCCATRPCPWRTGSRAPPLSKSLAMLAWRELRSRCPATYSVLILQGPSELWTLCPPSLCTPASFPSPSLLHPHCPLLLGLLWWLFSPQTSDSDGQGSLLKPLLLHLHSLFR